MYTMSAVVSSNFSQPSTLQLIFGTFSTIFKFLIPSKYLSMTQGFLAEHSDQFVNGFLHRITKFCAILDRTLSLDITLFHFCDTYYVWIPSRTWHSWCTKRLTTRSFRFSELLLAKQKNQFHCLIVKFRLSQIIPHIF